MIVKKEFLQKIFFCVQVVENAFYALLLFMCLLSDTAPLLPLRFSPSFLPLDLGLKVRPKEKADVVLLRDEQR